MLKLALTGLWVALVTASAAYLSAGLMAKTAEEPAAADAAAYEQVETEVTSIPLLRGGSVLGYVIIQLNYKVEKEKLASLGQEPAPFLTDATFRAIFQNPQIDFTQVRASNVDRLTDAIKEEANKRLGEDLVHEVLIEQLNFVPREEIRTHWVKEK